MSCGLSTAHLDKINVYTFTQDWKHHCWHRCSLMTYGFAEVANASDLEGSSGLRWVQFQVNWCPSFFGQGEALSQRSGHVKRLLALHLTTNHTENTGSRQNIETKQQLLNETFRSTSYSRLTGIQTEHWWSGFPGSSQVYAVYIPPCAGGLSKEGVPADQSTAAIYIECKGIVLMKEENAIKSVKSFTFIWNCKDLEEAAGGSIS